MKPLVLIVFPLNLIATQFNYVLTYYESRSLIVAKLLILYVGR